MSSPAALPRISAPANRALAGIGVTSLDQLAGRSRSQLAQLHGMGPKALGIIEDALAQRGLHLAD